MDRRRDARRPRARAADARARLPAAPRLRPPALRSRTHPRPREALRAVDAVVGELIEQRARDGARRHRALGVRHRAREPAPWRSTACCASAGLLAVQRVRDEWELLDAGASRGLRRRRPSARARLREATRATWRACASALPASRRRARARRGGQARRTASTTRARASSSRSRAARFWFSYYYWLDDARAPDFARTVDIHRKPGYDPVELFLRAGTLDEASPRVTARPEGARLPGPPGRDPDGRLARPRISRARPLLSREGGRPSLGRQAPRARSCRAH